MVISSFCQLFQPLFHQHQFPNEISQNDFLIDMGFVIAINLPIFAHQHPTAERSWILGDPSVQSCNFILSPTDFKLFLSTEL